MEIYIGLIIFTAIISLITGYSFGKSSGVKLVLKNSDAVKEILDEILNETRYKK